MEDNPSAFFLEYHFMFALALYCCYGKQYC